ncbi:MAG: hypothetical protein KJ626_14775 [Verrucomicrobia bacterium]|nr:hypothetical protein [Verrucomicrobiota bacterium]
MRRLFFWPLLLLFIAACMLWTFFFRPVKSSIYRAIPADVTFLSTHQDLAGRWDDFRANPLAQSLFHTLGVSSGEIDALSADPNFRETLRRLASDELVLGYVPEFGFSRDPAWIFVSWIGRQDVLLRWILGSGKISECELLGRKSGWNMWSVVSPGLSNAQFTQFAVGEGVLIGCISKDPRGIRFVLDAYDGRMPSVSGNPGFADQMVEWRHSENPDKGWYRREGESVPGLLYELKNVDSHGFEGSLVWDTALAGDNSVGATGRFPTLNRLFGDLPVALLMMNSEPLVEWLPRNTDSVWMHAVRELLAADVHKTAVAGLFTDDYSGRYMGIKLPGLVLAVQADGHDAARQTILGLLDVLNAKHQLGLIAREAVADNHVVYMIESTSQNLYSKLSYRERIACTYLDGWLLVSSNYDTLQKLLSRYAGKSSPDDRTPVWAVGVGDTNSAGYGWIDLMKGGKSIRLALSAYSFRLALKESRGESEQRRERIGTAKAWIDALAPLKVCSLRLNTAEGETRLHFSMGDRPPTTGDQ